MALKPARLQWSENGDLESLDYGDVYFQRGSAFAESDYVFLQHNNLPARFAALGDESFHIAEMGFGTGLNFLRAATLFLSAAPAGARLVFTSIEKHPITPEMLAQVYAHFSAQAPEMTALCTGILAQYPPLIEGFHTLLLAEGRIRLTLCFGEAVNCLPQISGLFDAWFLDGFSPAKNPDMWHEALFPLIAERTRGGGTLASFSVAGHMRRALAALGFDVRKEKGFGIKWSMTAARKTEPPQKRPEKKPVAVLGGGIAGCAAAWALARRGYAVTLIDRQKGTAQETSGNPVGIVYPKITVDPSPMGMFHAHGFCYTRMLCAALPVPSWQACGVRHIDKNEEEAARHAKQVEKNALPFDYACHKDGALHLPMAGFLSPPALCKALADHENIRCVFSKSALRLQNENGVWHICGADGDIICAAAHVVIALGNQSLNIAETAWLPLQSLRGQISYIRPTAASGSLKEVICHDGYIAPPDMDGLQVIGATFQKEPVAVPDIRAEDHAENVAKLAQYLPELGVTPADVIGGRTGYRATTPDKLPAAGPAPDAAKLAEVFTDLRHGVRAQKPLPLHGGIYISTGYGAHGMSGAPLCGEMIAAMIADEPLPVPAALADALAPARFLLRDLKRGKA